MAKEALFILQTKIMILIHIRMEVKWTMRVIIGRIMDFVDSELILHSSDDDWMAKVFIITRI